MRPSKLVLSLLASICLSACSATSGIDDLGLGTSNETTSSIQRPSVPVAQAAAASDLPEVKPGDTVAKPAPPIASAAPMPAAPVAMLVPEAKPVAAAAAAIAAPVVAAAAPGLAARQAIMRTRFRDAKPINFGPVTPRHYAVHGVDVSRWQGEIDWPKLRSQGANFAYIKATDGGDHLDPMFRKNWRAAHEAGLKRGAYHFFYWCRTAGEQADWFIRNVPRVEGALPPVIDVEWNGESRCRKRPSPERVREKMQVFMDKLEAHYGQRPVIYTAPDFYDDNLRGHFTGYPFWLRAVAQHPSKVYPGRKWVFWQYSGSGLSHGVDGKIDLNVFQGSERDWNAWIKGQAAMAKAD